MKVASVLSRELPSREVFVFFLLATLVYVLPLILVDYYYIDDNWRSLAAGTGWAGQGRLLVELFYNALSFTSGAPDMFPLPLLIATLAMAFALTKLTMHYYKTPTVSCCLVLLPLWYNPFFLQNLSYQYDGPATALSLVAVMYAVAFQHKAGVVQLLVSGALLAVGLSLYQLSINVFLGLCCIEFVRGLDNKDSLTRLLSMAGVKAVQLVAGLIIYFLLAYPLMTHERLDMIPFNASGLMLIQNNIGVLIGKIGLLFQGGNRWLAWLVVVCAVVGGGLVGRNIIQGKETSLNKMLLFFLYVLMVLFLVFLVSGSALLFRFFNEGARTLMGFGVLLAFLFYLAHQGVVTVNTRLGVVLLVPLLSMLSMSYAYGRVLNLQKEFGLTAEFNMAYDIASHPGLREAKRIYMSISYSNSWLLSAKGSFERIPVLKYILNIDFYMLSENLLRAGITNVVIEDERRNATLVRYQGYAPVVDSKFYSMYLIGDYGFIVMKEVPSSGEDKW
ncbi:glucosyltransferase domain-containing protein [Pseudomonas fluorescens]|uniref:glucosyltransferase domain-containing protein n=1 Tax=Pseudomonas fluorescens TaxID=294 RepID=UPI003D2370D7